MLMNNLYRHYINSARTDLMPMFNVSAAPIMLMASIMLLHSFTTKPLPLAPQWTMLAPIWLKHSHLDIRPGIRDQAVVKHPD